MYYDITVKQITIIMAKHTLCRMMFYFISSKIIRFRNFYKIIFYSTMTTMAIMIIMNLLLFIRPSDSNHEDIAKYISIKNSQYYHQPINLTLSQKGKLFQKSNIKHMKEVLDNICIVRNVSSPGHRYVKHYIKDTMLNLGWMVESDTFTNKVPIFRELKFENIIAKLNPSAERYLVLACHYDSKYMKGFIGATDSAVPCAQMINLATVMHKELAPSKQKDLSLMFIFFDGEEAFQTWGPKDSIYGARHLAEKWHNNTKSYGSGLDLSELDKMDMLILLDLIGAPNPRFYNYFQDTTKWYNMLVEIETELSSYSSHKPYPRYFQPIFYPAQIEDDHIPFMRRNVSILHIIPTPFPPVWHQLEDNCDNIDLSTVERINKILRIFLASYLHLDISS